MSHSQILLSPGSTNSGALDPNRLHLHWVALLCGRSWFRTVKGNSFRMGYLQFYNSCSQEAEVHAYSIYIRSTSSGSSKLD